MPITDRQRGKSAARMRRLWEDAGKADKTRMARKLGFKGSDATARDSASRLISSSKTRRRKFTTKEQVDYIAGRYYREYGAGEQPDVAKKYQSLDVSEYFKGCVEQGERAWTGSSPPLVYATNYRITARIFGIYEASTRDGAGPAEGRSHQLWTSGTADNFPALAAMLQNRIDALFDAPGYRCLVICFSMESALATADKYGDIGVPADDYGIWMFSSTVKGGEGFTEIGS